MSRRTVLVPALFLTAVGGTGYATASVTRQPPTLTVRVREEATARPLPNAQVSDLVSGTQRFTDERGEARLTWPAGGQMRLRVRQIGFAFVERTLDRATLPPPGDTVTVALERIPFALPSIVTTATDRCAHEVDSVAKLLSVPALAHLRLGAERYEAFRRAYPFRVRQERRTITLDALGKPKAVRQAEESESSENWGERYDPRRIVERTSFGFSVPILFVSALADPRFWERHCFMVRGVETIGGRTALRLEFAPARGLRGAEWEGAAYTDSATSLLRRVEFRLAGLRHDDRPTRFEGYTTFSSPSPLIAIPESTVAMWWRRPPTPSGTWGFPDVVQLIRTLEVQYRKEKPPAADSSLSGDKPAGVRP